MIDSRIYALRHRLSKIKNVILVGSGKGGVGKSTIASLVSEILSEKYLVGLLDADVHGPVQQLLFNIKGKIEGDKDGIIPAKVGKIKLMSIGYFEDDKPLPILGKMKQELVLDLLSYVNWGELDYLIIDLPPGTGDEVISVLRYTKSKAKAIVVTTPGISVNVVRRFLRLLENEKIPILFIVNNMAYIDCDGKRIYPFGDPNEIRKIWEEKYKIIEIPIINDFNKLKNLIVRELAGIF